MEFIFKKSIIASNSLVSMLQSAKGLFCMVRGLQLGKYPFHISWVGRRSMSLCEHSAGDWRKRNKHDLCWRITGYTFASLKG